MTDSIQTPALSGRELSRARRQEMSRTGGAKINAGRSPATSRAKAPVATSPAYSSVNTVEKDVAAVQAQTAPPISVAASLSPAKSLSGKALSMARRTMLAKSGKKSLPATVKAVGRRRNGSVSVVENQPEACCDSCAEDNKASALEESSAGNIDAICDLVDSNAEGGKDVSSSVRAFCRDRRQTMSQKGKLGLPGKAGQKARQKLVRGAGSASSSLTGKAMAKLRREDRCAVGRGSDEECRPSGRVRPTEAPSKVEIGTTLSGQAVSGTQVEQTSKMTGVESGVCHSITGTEYLGVEQFNGMCGTAPKPAQAKVGVSETANGQLMTGTRVVKGNKITGGEAGDCKSVTGSEYLGVEHFESICSTRDIVKAQDKVIVGRTAKDLQITGADEARDNSVTGSESGSNQRVTGSEYVDMQTRSRTSSAPAKVEFSHTAMGLPVSGGESSRVLGITGDEQDSCGRVTGTEYVSSERFESTCGSRQAPSVPAKVGVDNSQGGMTITGNLVDRDEKVTGNEPGTCQHVTGSQYDSSASKGFCNQRSNKVHDMHTLHGRPLTGTEVSPSPKLTGDDRGNCSIVTGNEYVSRESLLSCSQQPVIGADKTAVSRTWNHQLISGTQPLHSDKTTGDEVGLCNTVTGSSYAARDLASEFCANATMQHGDRQLQQAPSSQTVSGLVPGADVRLVGNFQRGGTQVISGTPYQERAATNVYHADFSVMSPAKAAWQQRDQQPIHNSVLSQSNVITGAINKAQGVISGTPEFRYPQHEVMINPVAPTVVTNESVKQAAVERVTGEGSELGTKITGDDWSRGGLITGTEGLFSAKRNQTQRGGEIVEHNKIGAHALKDREPMAVEISKITGASGGNSNSKAARVTLSGGACG